MDLLNKVAVEVKEKFLVNTKDVRVNLYGSNEPEGDEQTLNMSIFPKSIDSEWNRGVYPVVLGVEDDVFYAKALEYTLVSYALPTGDIYPNTVDNIVDLLCSGLTKFLVSLVSDKHIVVTEQKPVPVVGEELELLNSSMKLLGDLTDYLNWGKTTILTDGSYFYYTISQDNPDPDYGQIPRFSICLMTDGDGEIIIKVFKTYDDSDVYSINYLWVGQTIEELEADTLLNVIRYAV